MIFLPDADILIAATAYEKADKLITGNLKHFKRFPNKGGMYADTNNAENRQ